MEGGGETLGKTNFQGTSDLKNLQQQLSQVVDLDSMLLAPAGSHVSLDGTLTFHAHTDGDFTAADSKVAVGADFSAKNLNINIPWPLVRERALVHRDNWRKFTSHSYAICAGCA